MSIAAVGGVSPQFALQQVTGPAKPESAEVPGAPDHDGDADDTSTSKLAPGNLSQYA